MSAAELKVKVSECVLVHMGSWDVRGCASRVCTCVCTCVCAFMQGGTLWLGLGLVWGP